MKTQALCAALLLGLGAAAQAKQSLYARIGGLPKIAAYTDRLVELEAADPFFYENPRFVSLINTYGRPGVKFLMAESIAANNGGASVAPRPSVGEMMRYMQLTPQQREREALLSYQAMNELQFTLEDQKALREWTKSSMMNAPSDYMIMPERLGDGKKLYGRLGGIAKITKVADAFVDKLNADNNLPVSQRLAQAKTNPFFTMAGLKVKVAEQLAQISGGPYRYSGKPMVASISANDWRSAEMALRAVLDDCQVPTREQRDLVARIDAANGEIIGE